MPINLSSESYEYKVAIIPLAKTAALVAAGSGSTTSRSLPKATLHIQRSRPQASSVKIVSPLLDEAELGGVEL
jgi:hypothetical protein